MQRDWFGHAVQFFALLAAIGIPLVIWGAAIQSSLATTIASQAALSARLDVQDKAASEFRAYQTLVSTQMVEINRSLGGIVAQIGDIKDGAKRR